MGWQEIAVAAIVLSAVAFLIWKVAGGRRSASRGGPDVKPADLVRKRRKDDGEPEG